MSPFVTGMSIVAAVAVLEIILSWKWHSLYFRFGLPIFWRRIERTESMENVSLEELEKSAHTVAGTPLLFRRIDAETIAFREKAFGGSIHYVPIMHGLIRRNAGEPFVTLTGLANWWAVALLATMLIVIRRRDYDEILPYFTFAYGVLYLISAVRYNRVAKKLRTGVMPAPLEQSTTPSATTDR